MKEKLNEVASESPAHQRYRYPSVRVETKLKMTNEPLLERTTYTDKSTIGKLYINGVFSASRLRTKTGS